MTHFSHLWAFFALVLGIIVLPGMDMAYVLGNALSGGTRRGLSALAGIVVGGAGHTLLAALGLGVVVRTVPWLFSALLLAGAAYLAWLGWQLLRSRAPLGLSLPAATPNGSSRSALAGGAAVCLLNPKAYLFMLAVFPQFARPEYGSMGVQFVLMGILIALAQVSLYGGMVLMAGQARQCLAASGPMQLWLTRAVGAALIAAALWSAGQLAR